MSTVILHGTEDHQIAIVLENEPKLGGADVIKCNIELTCTHTYIADVTTHEYICNHMTSLS